MGTFIQILFIYLQRSSGYNPPLEEFFDIPYMADFQLIRVDYLVVLMV